MLDPTKLPLFLLASLILLLTPGPAVGVFGKYERVERGDGTPVEIPELLEFARKAARDAIAGEFHGDNVSTLYSELR